MSEKATSTVENTENKLLSGPQPSFPLNEIYVLRYKDRSLIAEKHFRFPSNGDAKKDKLAAIKRGQDFCDRMRFRFIHCEPFCIDLDEIEKNASAF